jgi:ABC-type glycerol-3-phosphate transport system permease component
MPIDLVSLITPCDNGYEIMLAGVCMAVMLVILILLSNQQSIVSGLAEGSLTG